MTSRFTGSTIISPARAIAINLLCDCPELSLEEAIFDVEGSGVGCFDSISRTFVSSSFVVRELRKMAPHRFGRGQMIKVYHATAAGAADLLLRRGFIPETKPRLREGFEYSPGHGLDRGLYVGETPRAVEGYGKVTLEVTISRRLLFVPTELRQLGRIDAMEALKLHDGAVIYARIPASAFKRVD